MGTDHPSMKSALVISTEMSCQRFVCSVEIWFLLNPERTDQVFAWPDGHRWSFHLGHARESCQQCRDIHGPGWLDNQRLPSVGGMLSNPPDTALPSCSDSLWVCYFSSSTHWTFKHPSAAAVSGGTKRGQFGTGGTKPFGPVLYCHRTLSLVWASLTCTFPFSCLERNVCMKPLALNT